MPRGKFHDSIRKSIFYANLGADRRGFDRNARIESPKRSLRFQLGHGFGSGMRKKEEAADEAVCSGVIAPRPLEEDAAMARKLKPMHPGEVLRDEFLLPLKMSAGALAKACGLPRTRIERIASEQTGITADTALRLAKALGTTAQLWLNLQNDYDVQIAKRDLGKILDRIVTVNKPKAA
jgi:addiction module HigA family antidote